MKQSTLLSHSPLARASQARMETLLADNRRLEFLRFLSTQHPPISADTVLWMEDLLERARLVRYHYVFKFAERSITDDLIFHHGTAKPV